MARVNTCMTICLPILTNDCFIALSGIRLTTVEDHGSRLG
jgi:hypothetical protein